MSLHYISRRNYKKTTDIFNHSKIFILDQYIVFPFHSIIILFLYLQEILLSKSTLLQLLSTYPVFHERSFLFYCLSYSFSDKF